LGMRFEADTQMGALLKTSSNRGTALPLRDHGWLQRLGSMGEVNFESAQPP